MDTTTFSQVITSFIAIFVIMDPFVSLPVLLGITSKSSPVKRARIVNYAIAIASIILLIFFVSSTALLSLLGISFGSFMIGGGIILLIMGIENVLGISFEKSKKTNDVGAAAVVIGTPLLTGPGVIATVIILVEKFGHFVTGIAAILALLATWIILRQATRLYSIIGERTIAIFSRVIGLLLTGIGIEIIAGGARRLILGV